MSNLTSDRDTEFVDELHRDDLPVAASTKICNGAAVGLNSSGFAVSAGPGASALRGIADETVDNTADTTGGALSIKIICPEAAYWDAATTFTQANVGKPVYFSDDHTVTLTAGTNLYAGRLKSVDEYGALVDMRGGYAAMVIVPQSAPTQTQAGLTDSSGGTVSTTLAAITAGATYAQADAVAAKNAIASINAQLNEVKADVAAVLSALSAAGVT